MAEAAEIALILTGVIGGSAVLLGAAEQVANWWGRWRRK
jgi:hypothetical protein